MKKGNAMSYSLPRMCAAAAVLLSCVAVASADTIRDATWSAQTSGVSAGTAIMMISGTTTDNLVFTPNVSNTIHKYNAATGSWSELQSWNDHRSSSANWSGVSTIFSTASGNNIYVLSSTANGVMACFDGTSWSDVSLGTARAFSAPVAADGGTAVGIGGGGTGCSAVKVVDGACAAGFPKNITSVITLVQSLDGNGSGVYWARDNSTKVAKSTDGGQTWALTSLLPVTGVAGGYSIHAIDADRAIVSVTNKGRVYRTNDGGATWEQVGGTFATGHARGLLVNDWDDIIAFGSFGGIYHWNGTDWASIALPDQLSTQTMRSAVRIGDDYWVVGNDGLIYTTVPEPGTMCLLGVGGVIALIRRRNK